MTRHLVIQLARFGDLIQTARLMASLTAEEGAEVHLAVDGALASLARALYPAVTVHALDAHATAGRRQAPGAMLARNAAALAELAGLGFTSVYALNYSGLSFALAGMFPPETVRGYRRDQGQDLRSRWCRTAFRWTGERRISPLNLVDFWGLFADHPCPPEGVNPVATLHGTGGAGRIGIVLAGREARRSLPPEVLAPCVEALFTAMGGPELVLIGSAAERPLARRLMRRFNAAMTQKARDMTGMTAMHELPDLFSGFNALVTPDTGTMHLAARLGVPVRAFFLSSAWAFETGPYGAGHTVWQATRPCAPCVETTPCPYGVACLAPFRDPAFLRSLAKPGGESGATENREDWPEGLVRLEPRFDALGQDYAVVRGAMPELARRAELRAAIQVISRQGKEPVSVPTFERLAHERDWMLPDF